MTTGHFSAAGPIVHRDVDGVPLVGYTRSPGAPAVTVARWTSASPPGLGDREHAHDFLVLLYVEHRAGPMTVDGRTWHLDTGDVLVIAPGAVVTPSEGSPAEDRVVWAVFFPPDLVDPDAPSSPAAWRAHPLLYPFTRLRHPSGRRLHVVPEQRAAWLADLTALADELGTRRDGYAEAARAHVTLLLVRLARLDTDVPDDLRRHDEPLLAATFDEIEARFRVPVSTRDVAAVVGVSPGHLTTVLRRGTGRTVGQWLTERRLQEARRLLATSDLTVAAVAGRVGYPDPGYFVRRFRAAHGLTPQEWRRAG
ncbi:AraC family transcriptional regulator [Actinomycetospora endophytica]|uniref:AraC family transcriptional regulator n=1 Tax=Actinomycetospora endophytica TaxID=2291215 RepID=A0ABS8PER8_9PSEU|nr:AraC family transcriptional regulator [Actinomycetospora endophytica]MCD2196765.1 AraC family transcriptional regulator [Actinomycetospora endophytica]